MATVWVAFDTYQNNQNKVENLEHESLLGLKTSNSKG